MAFDLSGSHRIAATVQRAGVLKAPKKKATLSSCLRAATNFLQSDCSNHGSMEAIVSRLLVV